MDAASALDSLSTLLTSLLEAPYSLALHAQHIQLASQPELVGQFTSAVELFQGFYAATDKVWLPFLHEKIKELGIPDDFESADEPAPVDLREVNIDAVSDVLALFEKAEKDYLSIPILHKKMKLLTFLHASYVPLSSSPDFEPLLAENAVRAAIANVVARGSTHLTQGHLLWDAQVAWELGCLKRKPDSPAHEALKEHIMTMHMDRLGQIHSSHEQTLQSYSSFISENYSASEYEPHLILASQTRAGPAKAWEKKEKYELALVNTPEQYQPYISSEERVKSQKGALVNTLYERAIAEYASRRWDAYSNNLEAQAIDVLENTLRKIWCNYIDAVRALEEEHKELEVIRRAIRSVPGSGEIWARYIRALERMEDSKDSMDDDTEEVADAYTKALSTALIQQSVDQIVPLVLARAGYENRHMIDDEGVQALITTLKEGISMVRNAAKEGDPRMTLEMYLASFYSEANLTDESLALWKSTAAYYKNSYLAWSKYLNLLIAPGALRDYPRARALFKDVSARALDWPEAIWQAWSNFEHLHGTLEEIENCLEVLKVLTTKLERKRAQEATEMAAAQKAWIEASLTMAGHQEAEISATEPAADVMAVDSPDVSKQPEKRKADDPSAFEVSKRVRLEGKPNLKRDRENSTLFVTGLVDGTTEDDLLALFKDCGKVREIKLSALSTSLVATVEFFDKASIPAALTKDKKRVKEEEIAVHLAWQSTLYVTNFPEKTEDASIRELFSPYGELFDVRWPSKKYRSTRRFCYVQYTSPSAAKAALVLHGRELEHGRALTVYVSNPERKNERTDAAANAREIYVAGLSKSVTETDLRKLFEKFGSISSVRMMLDEQGNSRGFAFVEFETEAFANASLAANNQELKKRRIAVTLADTRVQPRQREGTLGSQARRSRTLRVKNVPPGTQEGLLQQALEQHADVKRVEIFQSKNEAIVELTSVAEAGKLLLMREPITFGDRTLKLLEEDLPAPPHEPRTMFVPRGAAGRPRAGIGSKKSTTSKRGDGGSSAKPSTSNAGAEKGQDDFRRMLNTSI